MSSIAISSIAFVSVFGGAMLGMFLRSALPQHHLSDDSKDVMKLGMALVATMSALVLGLLITSAKSSYDEQNAELTDASVKVVLLDRALAHYGPETKEMRDMVRAALTRALDRLWSSNRGFTPDRSAEDILFDKIQKLSPKDDGQRALKSEALSLTRDIAQIRWLQYEEVNKSIPGPVLVVLISWLTTLFIGFGLLARPNGTVIISLSISALSVSSAIFLILELFSPYTGVIKVSSVPFRAALMQLGK
jgi:hypothetical protein